MQHTGVVVCATRGSALALAQTRTVAAKLAQFGTATTIVTIATTGDRIRDRSLSAIGSDSVFVKELETALRERRAQYAVHSCKDLPSVLAEDMRLAAISAREDPRDVFCSEAYACFADLPAGARVGTSSPRRRAQLIRMRRDLQYVDVRGNIDTRLRKLADRQYDALVLAAAGLRRLNARSRHMIAFEIAEMVPAVGQGALAVELLESQRELAGMLWRAVNDPTTEMCVRCERAALRTLRGGCQAPIGIHARFAGAEMVVDAFIADADGNGAVREQRRAQVHDAAQAEELGCQVGRALMQSGAAGPNPR
ncbi:MAG TPA: hydroxymethylbilane synthase [Candidatus Baltobacteraceae bacterium]|nr:hydroxymethylbilane synthase [Candidatus Baltobacteraceae bacterium]